MDLMKKMVNCRLIYEIFLAKQLVKVINWLDPLGGALWLATTLSLSN